MEEYSYLYTDIEKILFLSNAKPKRQNNIFSSEFNNSTIANMLDNSLKRNHPTVR